MLYQLQQIDNQLDELEDLRGDLPNMVRELEEKINSFIGDIDSKEKEQKDSITKRDDNEDEIEKLKENQKKFKAQLYQVRNNKEYDALTKEIDNSEELINKMEAENNALADASKGLANDIESVVPQLEELKAELKIKEAELKEIIKANEKEEAKLKEKRKSRCNNQTRRLLRLP